MKATGIIRRIDELGRIVIPKEIRKTSFIRNGDPIEIFTDKDGAIILKKYSLIQNVETWATACVNSLFKTLKRPIIIVDTTGPVNGAGTSKNSWLNRELNEAIREIIDERNLCENLDLVLFEGQTLVADIVAPIISDGDVLGAVIVCKGTDDTKVNSDIIKANLLFMTNIMNQE